MKRPPAIGAAVRRGLAPLRGRRAAQLLPRARLGGPMPWVLAIMTALTVLALGGALAIANMAAGARDELARGASVQILAPDRADRLAQQAAAARVLAADPAVLSVRAVPEAETAALLAPWLGDELAGAAETVPIPALVDIRLRAGADDAALSRMRAAIGRVAPAARVHRAQTWLAPVLGALDSLKVMAAALIALLALTGVAAVWLAARNALGSNRDTVEIVHLLGGSDTQIARVFQRSILIDAVVGGAAGLALGAAATLILGDRFAALDSGMVAAGGLSRSDWILIATVPLFAVAIAVYTARMTVISALRKLL